MNRERGNALWLMGGRAAQLGLSLVVSVLTARYLGPADYGLLQYAAAFAGFFYALTELGLNSVLVPRLTLEPEREGQLLGTALAMRLPAGLLATALMVALVLPRGEPVLPAVTGICGLAMTARLFDSLHCRFQARLRSGFTAAVLLAGHLVGLLWRIAGLVQGRDVVWFALGTLAEQLAAGLLALLAYVCTGGAPLRASRQVSAALWSKSRHFILPALLSSVCAQTDRIMLSAMAGQTQTGWYSAAVSVCGGWCFVLSALIDSAGPGIVRAHSRSREEFCSRNKRLYALVFRLSTAMALVLTLTARPLMGLMYGEAYAPAVPVLRLLCWYVGFSYLGVARNAWVVCENRQKHLLAVYAAAAAANVAGNLLLIPRLGAVGAALASLLSQAVSAVAAPLWIRSLRENGIWMLEAMVGKGVGK